MPDNDEIEKFENLLLDWVRTVTIFFIAGIALYHFTIDGKPYAIIAFLITIIMVTTLIVDYLIRRNELTSKGHEIRLPLDILVITMILGLVLILYVTFDVIFLPYNNTNGTSVHVEPAD